MAVLDVDVHVAERYSQIYGDLRENGTPIPTNDMWIAATASANGMTVLTFDAHFNVIPQVDSFTDNGSTKEDMKMANEGRMYHNNPLPPGVYGECVARGYSTGDAVMAAWMNSTGHRNIILGNYSQVGVGYVAVGGWWTLQFA